MAIRFLKRGWNGMTSFACMYCVVFVILFGVCLLAAIRPWKRSDFTITLVCSTVNRGFFEKLTVQPDDCHRLPRLWHTRIIKTTHNTHSRFNCSRHIFSISILFHYWLVTHRQKRSYPFIYRNISTRPYSNTTITTAGVRKRIHKKRAENGENMFEHCSFWVMHDPVWPLKTHWNFAFFFGHAESCSIHFFVSFHAHFSNFLTRFLQKLLK